LLRGHRISVKRDHGKAMARSPKAICKPESLTTVVADALA
jgi:hypothetical protein